MLGFFMKVYNSELFPGFLACLLTIGNKAVLKLKNMPTYFIKSSVYQIDWSSRTNFLVLQGLCTTKLVLPRLRPLFMNDNLVKPLAKPRCLQSVKQLLELAILCLAGGLGLFGLHPQGLTISIVSNLPMLILARPSKVLKESFLGQILYSNIRLDTFELKKKNQKFGRKKNFKKF